MSDSYAPSAPPGRNLSANGIEPSSVTLLGSFDPVPERIDLLLVKVPKSLALLDDQLRRLAAPPPRGLRGHRGRHGEAPAHLDARGLRAAARADHHLAGPEEGPTDLLAVEGPAPDAGEPGPATYVVEPGGHVVSSHAGVFSADQLDVGTRFFLEHLPTDRVDDVVDLGCGNGVVGMMAALADPDAEVTFVDDSYRAVASAEATFRANLGPDRPARFVVGNGLAELADGPPIADGSIDRVLNNPPFHVDQAVGDAVAWQMFSESRAALRPGGELWVVGNRHLAYHAKLKRLFGNCEVVASNAKFVVLRAERI